jgi:hypothetical protein
MGDHRGGQFAVVDLDAAQVVSRDQRTPDGIDAGIIREQRHRVSISPTS